MINWVNNWWSSASPPVKNVAATIIVAGGLGAMGATAGPLAAVAIGGIAAGGMVLLNNEDEKAAAIGRLFLGGAGAMGLVAGGWRLAVRPVLDSEADYCNTVPPMNTACKVAQGVAISSGAGYASLMWVGIIALSGYTGITIYKSWKEKNTVV